MVRRRHRGPARPPAHEAPPYGFDPHIVSPGGPDGPDFALLRLDAWRIELAGAPPAEALPATVWRRR